MKPFSSVMATNSLPSLLHDFSINNLKYDVRANTLLCCSSLTRGHCDKHQSAFQAVLDCKLEATAEPLPNSEAPEPKSPPPSILHSVVSNHILAKCHRSAQLEQISKAAKQSLGSKCMFSESCLHCYQMRLPHTNQINQQLPILQVIGSY